MGASGTTFKPTTEVNACKCEQECYITAGCQAWQFMNSGPDSGNCYLKDTWDLYPNTASTSGKRIAISPTNYVFDGGYWALLHEFQDTGYQLHDYQPHDYQIHDAGVDLMRPTFLISDTFTMCKHWKDRPQGILPKGCLLSQPRQADIEFQGDKLRNAVFQRRSLHNPIRVLANLRSK
mmetsp:Transcript_23160/g.56208  ORF Transcript_23160/g.56208 Transcript_23160/m.56208 type:complete len:178 (-) Transcript_23160:524-1057(-)